MACAVVVEIACAEVVNRQDLISFPFACGSIAALPAKRVSH